MREGAGSALDPGGFNVGKSGVFGDVGATFCGRSLGRLMAAEIGWGRCITGVDGRDSSEKPERMSEGTDGVSHTGSLSNSDGISCSVGVDISSLPDSE